MDQFSAPPCVPVLPQQTPEGPLNFLIPQGVNERVKGWSAHSIEETKELAPFGSIGILELEVDSND